MRALRIALVVLVVLAVSIGSAVAAVGSSPEDQPSLNHVTGSLIVDPQTSGGTFHIQDRVFQYRDYPIAGSELTFSDPRLDGELRSNWNWDIHSSGSQPVPSWGTMRISADENAWEGTFTGIRSADGQPFVVRAILFGQGAYDGLSATLDISASGTAAGDTWTVDGVIHPDPTES
ncbi:MAG: hypothetical protein ACC726_06235 [Chloroflexota bacterium]